MGAAALDRARNLWVAESDFEKIIGEPKSKTARWLNGGCIHHFNRFDALVAVRRNRSVGG
jgi:hypothetical protein